MDFKQESACMETRNTGKTKHHAYYESFIYALQAKSHTPSL